MLNIFGLFAIFLTSISARAAEESVIVSSGLGIASPSYHDGLNGENPTGLVANGSSKIHGEWYAPSADIQDAQGSAGVLIGNGYFGAGLELEKLNFTQVNWGLAGRIAPIGTTLAVTGHHQIPGRSAQYDAGLNFELGRSFQIGLAGFGLNAGLDTAGLGFLWDLNSQFSLTVDGVRGMDAGGIMVSPAIAFAWNRVFVLTLGYAFLANSISVPNQTTGVKGGFGMKLLKPFLLKYEYNDSRLQAGQHSLGLSIRF